MPNDPSNDNTSSTRDWEHFIARELARITPQDNLPAENAGDRERVNADVMRLWYAVSIVLIQDDRGQDPFSQFIASRRKDCEIFDLPDFDVAAMQQAFQRFKESMQQWHREVKSMIEQRTESDGN